MDEKKFIQMYETQGMVLIDNVLDAHKISAIKTQLELAISKEAIYHGSENHNDHGMVLCCAKYGGELLSIFENEDLFTPFETILGKNCIVYSNTSSSMPPRGSNYSSRIHIDCPIDFPQDYHLRMLSLIILDDFTEDNGATLFMPKSHKLKEKPTEREFVEKAVALKAKAGSVLYWNPKIWHAGGVNKTSEWRHAMTVVMTREFIRQRLDLPKLLGDVHLSNSAKKRLGYFSYPPNTYNDYYGRK